MKTISTFYQNLSSGWHPMRWVALGLGLFLGYNWLVNSAPVSGFLSIFFLWQAISNTGCIAGSCAIPEPPHNVSNKDPE